MVHVCVCGHKCMEESLEDTQQTADNDTVLVGIRVARTFIF